MATLPPSLTPPPEPQSIADPNPSRLRPALIRALPGLLGAGAGIIGGLTGSQGLMSFGAGMGQAGTNQFLEQNALQRQKETEQETNLIKNVDNTMQKVRQLNDPNDPRHAEIQAILQAYDQALQDGQMSGKEAAKLHQQINSIGDIEGMLGEAEQKRKLQGFQAQQEIEEKLKHRGDVQITPQGAPGPLSVSPEHALSYYGQQANAGLDADYKRASIENMKADNRRADAQLNLMQGQRSANEDDAAIRVAANALATGQARSLSEAMSMIGSARYRGDAGVKIMAAMGDSLALPPDARKRIGEINSSIDTLEQVRGLMNDVISAGPEERAEKSYLLDSFVHSNAAALSGAMGEKGVKTEGDIKRALGLVPGWFSANAFPGLAKQKLDMARDRFTRNKAAIVSPYAGVATRQGATPGMPNQGLTPPPGGAGQPQAPAQYQEGQTATNKATGQKLVFKGGRWVPVQ